MEYLEFYNYSDFTWNQLHQTSISAVQSVEKTSKTRLITIFTEKSTFSRQTNVFTKEVTKELISRKFLILVAFYSTFPHFAVWKNQKIPWNQLTMCFLMKRLISRYFCQVMIWKQYHNFHTVWVCPNFCPFFRLWPEVT